VRKLVLLGSLFILAGCDSGRPVEVGSDVKYRTVIERGITAEPNQVVVVFSAEVSRSVDSKTGVNKVEFICPCYVGDRIFRIEYVAKLEVGDKLIISLPPGADYNVEIRELTSLK